MYEFFESFVPGMGDEQLSLYSKHDGTLDEVLMGDAFVELKTRQISDLLSMSDDTKHVQIKDATHQVHTDKPEETLAYITEFINYCVEKN